MRAGVKAKARASSTICDSEQPQKNLARKEPRAGKAFGLKHPRIARNIGGVERAFAENGTKMIGQPLGNDESIGEQSGAEHGAEQDVAQKTGAAREQGQAADGNQAFVHGCFRFNRNAAGSQDHPPGAA